MALTPADVHNVAFSRPRIGKRGYSEQEVDLFIDLVEQELIRRIEEDAELRSRNAELRNRDGGLKKREAELAKRQAAFHDQECSMRKHEDQLGQQEALLAQREAQLARQRPPLPQQVAQLRYREAQVAQREAQLAQHEPGLEQREAQLTKREAELGQLEAVLRQRRDQQQAVASRVGSSAATNQVPRPLPARQFTEALSQAATVNGASHLEEALAVASVHWRHDLERMAIRAVTDNLGNTVTETVHERTRMSPIANGGSDGASEQSAELEQLKEENAELARSLGLIKSAAALLAAALDRP
jgi:DivIVA domain-containing protein